MTYKQLVRQLENTYKRIGKERDKLNDLIMEAQGILESADEGSDLLRHAIALLEDASDDISKYV